MSSSKVLLFLSPAATIPPSISLRACDITASVLPASDISFASKSLSSVPPSSVISPSCRSVYFFMPLFISTRSSSGINLTTLVMMSDTFFCPCIFIPFSFSSLAKPLLPSSPITMVRTKSDGMTAVFISYPASTLSFQDLTVSFTSFPASLLSSAVSFAVLLSMTALAIPSSVVPESSNPEEPRNIPKPSCAAPATPPSKEENAVCVLLYCSCAPASIYAVCAITS